jgi:carboxylate-amine ligase
MPYFLPHFIALSASSPLWRGEPTGMCSYRLAVQRETPRTGLPPSFTSADGYRRAVKLLEAAGVLPDPTYFWWDLRPSARYPTLELRAPDACTRIEDAITVAALYRCTLRMLSRLRAQNTRWREYSSFLLDENRWLAQRFGAKAALLDLAKGTTVPMAELVEEWLGLIAEDAAFFDCASEVAHARDIVAEGTSADRQIEVYEAALADGTGTEDALRAVVDHLIDETVAGCGDDDDRPSRTGRGTGIAAAQP